MTDKAVSKWETSRGLPGVSLVEPLERGPRGPMNEDERKRVIRAWKLRNPAFGVLSLRRRETGETFLVATNETARGFNRHTFQLAAGGHPCQRLQELWDVYGADGFDLAEAATLTYDDPAKDQSDALEKLLETCLETTPGAQLP